MKKVFALATFLCCFGFAHADTISVSVFGQAEGSSGSDSKTAASGTISAGVNLPSASASATQTLDATGAKGTVAVEGLFASPPSNNVLEATNTYVSTAATAGSYSFQLSITQGYFEAFNFVPGLLPSDPSVPMAGYALSIKVNGLEVFGSSITLKGAWDAQTVVKSGTDFGGTLDIVSASRSNYTTDAFATVLDLGFLNLGDEVTYELKVWLNSGSLEQGGSARIGDPNGLETSSGLLVLNGAGPTPVPEPTTLLLVALGFAGMAVRKRSSVLPRLFRSNHRDTETTKY
jgi:hypothetical protein